MLKAQVVYLLPRRALKSIDHILCLCFVILVFFVVKKHWIEFNWNLLDNLLEFFRMEIYR